MNDSRDQSTGKSTDLSSTGIPLSGGVGIVECFSPSEGGSRLDFRIAVIDPASFSGLVELNKFRLAVKFRLAAADVTVEPYECLPDSQMAIRLH